MIELTSYIQTPEGVSLQVTPAGPVLRTFAWSFDFFIKKSISAAVFFFFVYLFNQLGAALFLIFYFFFEWFYGVYFEYWQGGATPGKKIFGLKVLHDNATPVSFRSSMLRNILLFVDANPPLFMIAPVCALFTSGFKRLGDLAAGTIVVHNRARARRALSLPKLSVSAEAPPFPLNTDEKKSIASFCQRLPLFTKAKKYQLANLLFPLTGKKNSKAVSRIKSYAVFITGKNETETV